MLYTNLKHLESAVDLNKAISENENYYGNSLYNLLQKRESD
jgi:hypothetical protein